MRLLTIGFTKKPAQRFFDLLRSAGVKRVVDVRLNNSSQLAGFAKRDDLAWFLREIGGMDYTHVPALAPTQALLSAYRKAEVDWPAYEQRFLDLMRERRIEETVDPALLDAGCLLCSEDQPHNATAASSPSTFGSAGAMSRWCIWGRRSRVGGVGQERYTG